MLCLEWLWLRVLAPKCQFDVWSLGCLLAHNGFFVFPFSGFFLCITPPNLPEYNVEKAYFLLSCFLSVLNGSSCERC